MCEEGPIPFLFFQPRVTESVSTLRLVQEDKKQRQTGRELLLQRSLLSPTLPVTLPARTAGRGFPSKS